MNNAQTSRINMVHNQILPNKITSQPLVEALTSIPREHFAPRDLKSVAYLDSDLPLGNKRYLINPMVLSRLIQEADITSDSVVLDIACGSGYSTAILATLAHKVIALEEDNELAATAKSALNQLGITNTIIISADLTNGHPDGGPYDAIIINGAVSKVPQGILDQLADGGRLACVIAVTPHIGYAVLYERQGDTFLQRRLFDASVATLAAFKERA